ncbi:MAG: periplasmic heavy metal sensor, partial [Nitrospinae bacterium]|nr:periplasmic heavy metal sensor [Nitrospinota bacterium]
SKLQLAQLDFHEELQKDKPDRAKLDKLIATIVSARADMERQRLTMQVEMSQILTPDQRKRMMRHMGERMMEHRPGMSPGMMEGDEGPGEYGGPPSGHGDMNGPMMR